MIWVLRIIMKVLIKHHLVLPEKSGTKSYHVLISAINHLNQVYLDHANMERVSIRIKKLAAVIFENINIRCRPNIIEAVKITVSYINFSSLISVL